MKIGVTVLLVAAAAAAAAVWLLPIDVLQAWNAQQAGSDPYAQFEAVGQAEALSWCARLALPLLTAALVVALFRWEHAAAWRSAVRESWRQVTSVRAGDGAPSAWRTLAVRTLVVVWLLLFCAHLGGSFLQRGRDWAWFRWNSGPAVLPNISFENRAVIRYLQAATPERSRLLMCSDQSLFFVSYYLLPRRVFHKVHPDAEFTIPQPGQTRPLPAYRREELTREDWQSIRPDLVCEYFEGAQYVDPARLTEDGRWIEHWRRSSRETGRPPYLVVLSTPPAEPAP